MTQQQNTWDPRFSEIRMARRVDVTNTIDDVMTFKFGQYWPPYPFRLNMTNADLVIYPKIVGPNDPTGTLVWDQNWIGEIWIGDKTITNSEMVRYTTFDKSTTLVAIPRSKIGSSTQIAVRITGVRDGNSLLYDQFYFTLSSDVAQNPVSPGTGDGGATVTIPCYVTDINPQFNSLASTASSQSFSVVLSRQDCVWNISKTADWITLTGTTSRTGNSTVSYSVTENTTNDIRTGTILVGEQEFVVVQRGKPQTVTVTETACYPTTTNASSRLLEVSGGTSSFTIGMSKSTCPFTVTKDSDWITLSSPTSFTGSGTINYTVAQNTSTTPRVGTISTNGMIHVVVQKGKPRILTTAPRELVEVPVKPQQ